MTDNGQQSYGGQGNLSTQGNEQSGSDRNPNDTLRGGQQQGQADYGSAGQQPQGGQQEQRESQNQQGFGSQSQQGGRQQGQQDGNNDMSGSAQGGEFGTVSGGDGEQYGSGAVDAGYGDGSPSMQEGDAEFDDEDEFDNEDEDDLTPEQGASGGGAL